MQLFKNQLVIFVLSLFIFSNANAITIDINLEAAGFDPINGDQNSSSFTFGDYIFETLNFSSGLTLTNDDGGILIDNALAGGDFSLSRVDSGFFSLKSILHAGFGDTTIGGIAISHAGNLNFLNHNFSNEPGITNVDTILFSPNNFIQLSSFEVQAVPVPAAAWLFGSGLLGLVGVARRKKA